MSNEKIEKKTILKRKKEIYPSLFEAAHQIYNLVPRTR